MDFFTALSLGASAAAVIAALYGAYHFFAGLYRRTVGSRWELKKRLNQLACGVTRQYVEALFGTPIFRRELASNDQGDRDLEEFSEHVYQTKHAWLTIWYNKGEDAVYLISITVTDPKFRFHTAWLTFDQIKVRLGHSTFSVVSLDSMGKRMGIGARTGEYAESYYFGNPGGYAHYFLSHNMAGCGNFDWDLARRHGAPAWHEGDLPLMFSSIPSDPPQAADLALIRSSIVINTLTIVAQGFDASLVGKHPIGVVGDNVRMLRPMQRKQWWNPFSW